MAQAQLKQMRKDRFTEESLKTAEALANLKYSESEEDQLRFSEAYDFARCQRPDGSFYGTSGQCRKGKESGAKAEEPKKPAAAAPAAPKPEVKGPRTAGMTKADAERADMAAAVRKLKSQDAELRSLVKDKLADQKSRKGELDRLDRAFKAQEKLVKKEPTKENKERLKKVRTALIQQDRFYNRGERELEKLGRARLQLDKKIKRLQMSPAQRAEERRIRNIIKVAG